MVCTDNQTEVEANMVLVISSHDRSKSEMSVKKSVRFYKRIKIKLVPPLEAVRKTEKQERWYSKTEFAEIKMQHYRLVKQLSVGRSPFSEDENSLHANGLETKQISAQKQVNIRRGQLSVLLEQERQWENGERDPEEIRRNYRLVSKVDAYAAASRGIIIATQLRNELVTDIKRLETLLPEGRNPANILLESCRFRTIPARSPLQHQYYRFNAS